nr:chromosome condensation regulator RCC1 [Bdellovibrio sp. HM001]
MISFRYVLALIGFSVVPLLGCTLAASISREAEFSSLQEVKIFLAPEAQSAVSVGSSKSYKVQSLNPIKPESLDVSDFVQKGTAEGLILHLTPGAHALEFDLTVSVSTRAGTIDLELPAGSVEFDDGTVNVASRSDVSTVDRAQTYSRMNVAESTTCYIDSNSRVRCFGDYYGGQVGRGVGYGLQISAKEVSLSNVVGSPSFVKMSGGSYASCALNSDGLIYCWGDNYSDEAGIGPGVFSVYEPTPALMTNVEGEKKFVDFESNWESTCAVSAKHEMYCWGLLDAAVTGIPNKVDLTPLGSSVKVLQVAVGLSFACGLTDRGKIFCYGANDQGQLGDGTLVDSPAVKFVDFGAGAPAAPFVHIAAGESHVCALNLEGALYCWGANGRGQLGLGTTVDSSLPQLADLSALADGEKLVSVVASVWATCGVSSKGKAYCFGYNWHSLTADGGATDILIPTPVDQTPLAGGTYFVNLAIHEGISCGETNGRTVYCWGYADSEVRYKDVVAYQPQEISTSVLPAGQHWAGVYPSFEKNVLLLKSSDGTAYFWGYSIGLNATAYTPTPLDTSTMTGSTKFKTLAAGSYSFCGINTDDILHCVGNGATTGQGGFIQIQATMKAVDTSAVTGATTFASVSIGETVACAVATDGVGYCWGGKGFSHSLYNPVLGNGTSAQRYSPTPIDVSTIPVTDSRLFSKIVVSEFHACGLMTDQKVYCWGNSGYSRSGHSSANSVYRPQPLDTSGMSGAKLWKDIYGNKETFCGVSTDDIAYCWGDSLWGQLGNGVVAGSSSTPVPVTVTGLLAGEAPLMVKGFDPYSCGILDIAKNIYCWGNEGTSLAIEGKSAVPVPVARTGMVGNPTQIDGGKNLYITTDANKIYCVGFDCALELMRRSLTRQYFDNF